MVTLTRLVEFLAEHLEVDRYQDVALNGLQVEGRAEVARVVLGVSVSLELIERAAAARADAVVVHHGLFWGRPVEVAGPIAKRLRALLLGDISLLAYHIPLDAHPEDGNNARLAAALELTDLEPWGDHHGRAIGRLGRAPAGVTVEELAARVQAACGGTPLLLGARPDPPHVVAVCSGSAGSLLLEAAAAGATVLVTGEPGEPAQGLARETNTAVIGAGHYNSERLGVEALAARLEAELGLDCRFEDVPNPV